MGQEKEKPQCDQVSEMNQAIQEMTVQEIELVNGSNFDIDQRTTLAIEFPEVSNNPPG
jgi:hypothetical protein